MLVRPPASRRFFYLLITVVTSSALIQSPVVSGFSQTFVVSGFSRTFVESGFGRTFVESGFSRTRPPTAGQSPKPAPVATYRIVKTYPHDRQAFTQGLEYVGGVLYEGTGQNGQSGIRKVKLDTGAVLQQQPLDEKYFGEGITLWGKTLIQLTWQSETGFVYDVDTFKQLRSFSYAGEGWGLTHDATRLIMSDGTASLRFLDPNTLKEIGRVAVHDGPTPVTRLNELEFVRGEVLANVWQMHRIARISLKTGAVTGWVDLTGLLDAREAASADVLNGIAYDAAGDRLFVTGKWWPKLFEIKIVPRS